MENSDIDVFSGYGIEVELKGEFAHVREVLTRIGIANYKNKTLTQSCHIFHKRGRYAIMHFKEMFLFDGKVADFTIEDEGRRNRIVRNLEDWGLIKIIDPITWKDEPIASIHSVNIISRQLMKDENWELIKKYTLGRK